MNETPSPINAGPSEPHRRARRATAIGLTAGLLGGGAAGLLFAVPSLTNASGAVQLQESSTDSTEPPSTEPASTVVLGDAQTGDAPADDAARPDPTTRIREALQPLVDDGTISAEQADAVAGQLATSLPVGRGHGGPGGHGPGGMGRGMGGTVVADALGITVDELATALQGGQSIADVATAQGVDVQAVIDALVAEAKAHLDEEVAEGDLTQDEADTRLADLTARITDGVQQPGFPGGRGPGGRHGRGHGDDDATAVPAPATDTNGDTSSTSTDS